MDKESNSGNWWKDKFSYKLRIEKAKSIFTGQYWCPEKPYEWKTSVMKPFDKEKDHGLK